MNNLTLNLDQLSPSNRKQLLLSLFDTSGNLFYDWEEDRSLSLPTLTEKEINQMNAIKKIYDNTKTAIIEDNMEIPILPPTKTILPNPNPISDPMDFLQT